MDITVALMIRKLIVYEPDIGDNIQKFIIPKYKYRRGDWTIKRISYCENICIVDRVYDYINFKIMYTYCYNGGLSEGYAYEESI